MAGMPDSIKEALGIVIIERLIDSTARAAVESVIAEESKKTSSGEDNFQSEPSDLIDASDLSITLSLYYLIDSLKVPDSLDVVEVATIFKKLDKCLTKKRFKRLTIDSILDIIKPIINNPVNRKYRSRLSATYTAIEDVKKRSQAVDHNKNTYQKPTVATSMEKDSLLWRIVLSSIKGSSDTVHAEFMRNIRSLLRFIASIDTSGNWFAVYDNMFSFTETVCGSIGNTSARNAVGTILFNIKRYTEIDDENEMITIDVSSIITEIYKRYVNRSNKRWIYFAPTLTLGTNTSFFYRNVKVGEFTDSLNSGNFSFTNVFASEKFALRWKIINNTYLRSFDRGDHFMYYGKEQIARDEQTTPIFSELYFMVYVSGILYNIVDVKTYKSFNDPIFGAGFGVNFFNGLDLTLSAGKAFSVRTSKSLFIGFSFDIDIVEYFNQVAENIRSKR